MGGYEAFSSYWRARDLEGAGHQVHVISFCWEMEKSQRVEIVEPEKHFLEHRGIQLFSTNDSAIYHRQRRMYDLSDRLVNMALTVIDRFGADLILTSGFFPCGIAGFYTKLLFGRPQVMRIDFPRSLARSLSSALVRAALQRADRIEVGTHEKHHFLNAGIGEEKISTLREARNPAYFIHPAEPFDFTPYTALDVTGKAIITYMDRNEPSSRLLSLVRMLSELLFVFEAQGRLAEALNSYWQALNASVADLAASTSESFRQALRRCAGGTRPDSHEQAFMAMKKCRHLSETQNRLIAVCLHGIGRVRLTAEPEGQPEHFDLLGLSFREATLGTLHPLVAQSHLAVGRTFESQGKLEDARSHYRRASGIAESTLGPGHWVAGLSLYSLARIMRLQGQVEDAERFFNRAVAIIQNGLPPGSIPNEEDIRKLQMRIERDYALDELQGPEVRTTIARDSPRLPRDHQTLDELFEKKKADFLAMLQPGQKPGEVFKKFINMIDDPVDDLKHEVHGMVLFGRRIFWPEGFMQGAGDPCK